MSWTITEQVERENGCEFTTRCKHLKYFPFQRSDGTTGFGALSFVLLQVTLQNDRGAVLRLKQSTRADGTTYACQFANERIKPTIRLSGGRTVPDVLAPSEEKAGPKHVFETLSEFREFGHRVFGVQQTAEIEQLFNDRLQLV